MEIITKQKENKFELTKKHYIMFGIFFICFLSLLLIMPIAGDDYWWHTKVGEWIIENKKVPKTGIFSWYANENNLSWFAHEWLAEVVLYLFYLLFGENGGVFYLLVTLLLISTLLYCYNYKGYLKNLIFSCIWVAFGFFAIGTISTARPHMLTISLFAILIHICEQMKKDINYKWYLLYPIITLIWANYHGGSSNITYIIPIMYFITTCFNFKFGRIEGVKVKKNYRYLILGLLNFLTLFINPRTYQLIYYPYSYTSEHAQYILEWKAPSLTNGGFAIVLVIFICLIFFITKQKLLFSDLALVGCFMLLTLKSIRFDAWLYVATTMVIFKYIKELKDKSVYKYLSYEFLILGIAFLCYSSYCISNGTTYIEKSVSDEAIKVLKNEKYNHLMNFYDYGSYLIYKDIDVFIDGRADMYSGYNFKQEAEGTIFTYDYSPKQFIKEFDFDMFIVPKESYISYYLQNNKDKYKELYSDDDLKIFKEKNEN